MSTSIHSIERSIRRIVWGMVILMIASFAFGVAMFIPAEHRAEKLEETMARYQARRPGSDQVRPVPKKRIVLQ